jgi:hypothetical protein
VSEDLEALRHRIDSLTQEQRQLDEAVRSRIDGALRRSQDAAATAQEIAALERRRGEDLAAELAEADRRLAELRSSESYRLGNALAKGLRLPVGILRVLARRFVPRLRRMATAAVDTAGSDPRARALIGRLPERGVAMIGESALVRRAVGRLGGTTTRPTVAPAPGTLVGLQVDLRGTDAKSLTTEDLDPPVEGVDARVVVDDALDAAAGVTLDAQGTVVAATAALTGPPPIAVRVGARGGFGPDHDDVIVRLRHREDGGNTGPVAVEGLPPGRRLLDVDVDALIGDPVRMGEEMRGRLGAICDGTSVASPWRQAAAVVRTVAVGLPVALTASQPPLDRALGSELATALRDVDLGELTDPLERERTSQRLRNLVLHSADSRRFWGRAIADLRPWPVHEPSVSVLVASQRPDMIDAWSAMLARQDHPAFEVVACLHGEGFDATHESVLRDRLGDAVSVVRVGDTDASLGDVLNAGLVVASGDIVTKWDDDDLYGSRHLSDMTTALAYSGATIVGKAAEFVYLAGEDVTVRRFSGVMERGSRTLGGMTLTMRRDDLIGLGGWRRVPRQVDTRLIDAVVRTGGSTYRTAGFGLVVVRAAHGDHGHTWNPAAAEFLDKSRQQWRGLALREAGIDLTPDEVPAWLA